jgi:hypothetical protein
MRWPTSASALGSAAVSVGAAAVGVAVGALELSGRPHADIWSNGWVIGSIMVAGIGLMIATVFFVLEIFSRSRGESTGSQTGPAAGPANPASGLEFAPGDSPNHQVKASSVRQDDRLVTDRWRCTTDGFEVPALLRIRDNSIFHPALMQRPPGEKPSSVKIGVLVGCAPLGEEAATSAIRAAFLAFLGQDPVRALVDALTSVPDSATWRSWEGHGRISFAAVLAGDDDQVAPLAWARLNPPPADLPAVGRAPCAAKLVLAVEVRAADGGPGLVAGLAAWHDRLLQVLALPAAFAGFLAADLGLVTSGDPPAQVGVYLDAPHEMTELVDSGGLVKVPGSTPRNWFMGWALADPDAQPAPGLVRRWLTDLCDYALCLNGYENVLARLEQRDEQPGPATEMPERERVTNAISGGTFHGPVMQGRDFTGLTFPARAEPLPPDGPTVGQDAG